MFVQIGAWRSWEEENHGIDIQDIVWPGESHVPPQGVPEKFHITIGFLEEPPFINLARPDPVTGKCNVDRGIRCRVKPRYVFFYLLSGFYFKSSMNRKNETETEKKSNITDEFQCCSGFCIDLLAKMAEDLQFEFDLVRVEDPKWGTLVVRTEK